MYSLEQFFALVDIELMKKFGLKRDDLPVFDWRSFYEEEPEVADPKYAVRCFLEEIR